MVKIKKKNFLYFFIISIIFFIDRATKLIMINLDDLYGERNYALTSFINLELIWNSGIAFGMLSFENSFYYNLITSIIILITIIIFIMMVKTSGIQKYGFIMIFGGSIGNIFDRLIYSSVPDFIDIHFKNFHWFIFNVADIFITLGVLILIYLEFIKEKTNG
tara:strand:+ start:281 stop:766 length:486 start_codon:yes stop_codon:yes gene_type:complete